MAVKGQVLTNLVGEFTKGSKQVDLKEIEMPESIIMINTISPQRPWELFVNGAANQKGSGIGIVIISLKRITLEKSLRLGFSVTKNETEYKALQARLNVVKKLGGKAIKVHCDSRLVAG